MIFPIVNKNKIYEYKGIPCVIWSQDLFVNVYVWVYPVDPNMCAEYRQINWWSFMWNAKLLYIQEVK